MTVVGLGLNIQALPIPARQRAPHEAIEASECRSSREIIASDGRRERNPSRAWQEGEHASRHNARMAQVRSHVARRSAFAGLPALRSSERSASPVRLLVLRHRRYRRRETNIR